MINDATRGSRPTGRTNDRLCWAATLIALLALAFLTGCPTDTSSRCSIDSDCASDAICVDQRCAQTCSTDGDCPTQGFICRPYLEEDVGEEKAICRPSDAGPGTRYRCTSDEDCEQLDVGPAECGINGRCILVDRRRAIRVSNPRSSRDGPEIAGAYLVDTGTGDIVAYGNTLRYCPAREEPTGDADAGDASDTMDTSGEDIDVGMSRDASDATTEGETSTGDARDRRADADTRDVSDRDVDATASCRTSGAIDGSPVRLNDDRTCIRGNRSTTMALGPRGELYLEFLTDDGGRFDLDSTHELVVIEWGENCGGEPDDSEPYDIDLCTTTGRSFDRANCRGVVEGITGKIRVTVEPE